MTHSCPVCARVHTIQTRCSFRDLASRISQLIEANMTIPALMMHNKEATTIAQGYQKLLAQAGEAHEILMKVLAQYGDGELIKQRYFEELDKWAKETLNQDTVEQQPLEQEATKPSTPSETETKTCTGPTPGKPSLRLT